MSRPEEIQDLVVRIQPANALVPIDVRFAVARQMRIIKNMIEDFGVLDEAIPVPNVNSDVFDIVLEYCQRYSEVEDISSNQTTSNDLEINDWDKQFLLRHASKIYTLMIAANYLEVPGLLDLGVKYVVNNMCDKTPKQIREFFNIPNDWEPTLYKTIMKENGWNEDD
ncbi:putative E3 ubiquitin ligase complex SCF subunit sconC [Schizopora paradoxa]|uniref:E3 ubiquitin ligase complex SCF subunit n=1 Tax=Schizopora paradoxa TaxID=27342 RepID=A0A0H2QWP8_9AGAM|nr:putative E3 ubiquitin ligase complex SCF subunit sconC [Schizopora paradoxa]